MIDPETEPDKEEAREKITTPLQAVPEGAVIEWETFWETQAV